MTNIRDWCISRQLWWGHRIPAWYGGQAITSVSRDTPAVSGRGAPGRRHPRHVVPSAVAVLDVGWPDKTRDLGVLPNNVLVTGPDIIFFWVARSDGPTSWQGPFRTVY
jgi:valyl-tRNA synthetase